MKLSAFPLTFAICDCALFPELSKVHSRVHTAVFKRDNQQGPTVHRRELCSMLCASRMGVGVGGEQMHVYAWLSPFPVPLRLSQHC